MFVYFCIFVGMVLESMRIQESVVNVKKLADVFSCVSKDEDSQWEYLVATFSKKVYPHEVTFS